MYGENGKELPSKLHTYEIGSLTKTFTAALINKAISEGKINIKDIILNHLWWVIFSTEEMIFTELPKAWY